MSRLGYLLKHVQLRYAELAEAAFAPLGLRPQQWAALACLDETTGRSQKEVAELLGVDRTTMVAIIDELQAKRLVARRPLVEDRRKNIVSLTRAGRAAMQRGAKIADACEADFLAALDAREAERFKQTLQTVMSAHRYASDDN
jgi:DNA-binding MarR family transcriptional regulator